MRTKVYPNLVLDHADQAIASHLLQQDVTGRADWHD